MNESKKEKSPSIWSKPTYNRWHILLLWTTMYCVNFVGESPWQLFLILALFFIGFELADKAKIQYFLRNDFYMTLPYPLKISL